MFIRFVPGLKAAVGYGLDLMLAVFKIIQGMVSTIITPVRPVREAAERRFRRNHRFSKINNVGFWDSIPLWAVTLLGGLFITVLAFIMILTVYSRLFKLYMYTAIAPIPMSHVRRGDPPAMWGKTFLRSYAGSVPRRGHHPLACIIFLGYGVQPAWLIPMSQR